MEKENIMTTILAILVVDTGASSLAYNRLVILVSHYCMINI